MFIIIHMCRKLDCLLQVQSYKAFGLPVLKIDAYTRNCHKKDCPGFRSSLFHAFSETVKEFCCALTLKDFSSDQGAFFSNTWKVFEKKGQCAEKWLVDFWKKIHKIQP